MNTLFIKRFAARTSLLFFGLFVSFGPLRAQNYAETFDRLPTARESIDYAESVLKETFDHELVFAYYSYLLDLDSNARAGELYAQLQQSVTDPAPVWVLDAYRHFDGENQDSMLFYARKVFEADSNHLPYLRLYCMALLYAEKGVLAEKQIDQALLLYPGDGRLQYYELLALRLNDQADAATRIAIELVAEGNRDIGILGLAARSYLDRQMFHGAQDVLRILAEFRSESYFYNSAMASVKVGLNEPENAIPYRRKAFQNREATLFDGVALMELFYSQDMMDSACGVITEISSRFERDTLALEHRYWEYVDSKQKLICLGAIPSYYYERGVAAFNTGDYETAILYYDTLALMDPNSAIIHYFHANARFRMGDYEMAYDEYELALVHAEDYLEEAKAFFGDSIPAKASEHHYVELLQRVSEKHLFGGDLDSAIDYIQRAKAAAVKLGDLPFQSCILQEARVHIAKGETVAARELLKQVWEPELFLEKEWCMDLCAYYECRQTNGARFVPFGSRSIRMIPADFQPEQVRCPKKLKKMLRKYESDRFAHYYNDDFLLLLGWMRILSEKDGCFHLMHAEDMGNSEAKRLRDRSCRY